MEAIWNVSEKTKKSVKLNYTVEGWATSASGDTLSVLPGVTSYVSYYAIVSKVKQKYSLTFDCGENEIIAPITK